MKILHCRAAFAGLTLVALASAAPVASAADFTADQRKAIETIIRDYLLSNPEVLQDAMQELERRQQDAQRVAQRDAIANEKANLFSSPSDAVIGNPAGDTTLVVFHDYNCPYCKRAATDLDELVKSDGKLRVVLKEFPVVRPPDSLEAARIALAAKSQLNADTYRDFHMRLMALRSVTKDRAIEVAKDMKLDVAKLAKDAESDEIRGTIQKTVQLGERLGITGTPAFVVGDTVISGAVGVEPLRKAVASVRACGKALC